MTILVIILGVAISLIGGWRLEFCTQHSYVEKDLALKIDYENGAVFSSLILSIGLIIICYGIYLYTTIPH